MEKSTTSRGNSQPKSKKKKASDPRTLFVKFYPPSASITRQHLSDHFSNYGPVNRCSVIRQLKSKVHPQQGAASDKDDNDDANQNYDRGSKGYGFVRFVHEEDAKSAADTILQKKSRYGKKKSEGEFMVVDGVQYTIHAERAVDAAGSANNSKLKQKESMADNASASKDSPSANNNGGDDAANNDAKATPSKSNGDADAAFKAESKRKRTSRVIIRNISFYANERHIKSAMESSFGPVAAVDLPLVPDLPSEKSGSNSRKPKNKNSVPSHRGFAFVTFTNANAAKRAVEQGSEIKIKNRLVAIDFSVSKMEHQKIMKDEQQKKNQKEEDTESESESSSDSDSENEEQKDSDGSSSSDSSSEEDDEDSEDDSESEDGSSDDEEESSSKKNNNGTQESATAAKETPDFDESEAKRTLFLRNVPFDAKRHDVFELFRKFGRIEAVHMVKDRQTGVFKGTAFTRFESEKGCAAAMEASGIGSEGNEGEASASGQFVSSKNMAMGLGHDGNNMSGLILNGRHILVDLAVDRTTASSLAVQRDAEGKPIKKITGKDRRNLYLKNEGRVSSTADSGDAQMASAKHGGLWENLPQSDRAKRERAFAERSTKLRSPLFFINPNRISIRNLAKHINEAELKKLVFDALKMGLADGLATPKDAVAHWRAGGELAHSEVMRRATDSTLVSPPVDEKNMKGSVPSVYIDRDASGGKKMTDAPSRGFGFVEFTHHAHALAVLRQLNNNPIYSAEYAAGGKHASEMAKQKQGKKSKKKAKVDPETGAEFLGEDGRVCVPRLIVEFTVENKVKARQQAEKIAQKKANKIKQRIENKEKKHKPSSKEVEKKKGRGALQREKKRARKEAGEDDGNGETVTKKQTLEDNGKNKTSKTPKEEKSKMLKPKKKRKVDKDENALEDMIRSYKSSFSEGGGAVVTGEGQILAKESGGKAATTTAEPKKRSRDNVGKKRWFE